MCRLQLFKKVFVSCWIELTCLLFGFDSGGVQLTISPIFWGCPTCVSDPHILKILVNRNLPTHMNVGNMSKGKLAMFFFFNLYL